MAEDDALLVWAVVWTLLLCCVLFVVQDKNRL